MENSDPDGKRPRLGSYSAPQPVRMHHPPEQAQQVYHTSQLPALVVPPYHESAHSEHRALEQDPASRSYPASGYGTPVSRPFPPVHHHPPEQAFNRGAARSPTEQQQPQYRPLSFSSEGHHHAHPVDHSQHSNYPPHESNGVITHGMPNSASVGENGPGSYAPSPVSGQPYGLPYAVTGAGQGRRKAIRAQQACDVCRNRKAKCDEGRPSCGYCKEMELRCIYREVPPPKQDRTLGLILDRLSSLSKDNQDMRKEFRDLRDATQGAPQQQTPTERTRSQIEDPGRPREEVQRLPIEAHRPNEELLPPSASSRSQERLPTMPRIDSIAIDDIKHEDELAPMEPIVGIDVLSIPIEHTTAAQKLLRWPSIQSLIRGIKVNENYVMDCEESRGLLRLYGKGEGHDVDDGGQPGSINSPSNSSVGGDTPGSQASSPPESLWGAGFGTPNSAGFKMPTHDNVGGLNPDGSLKLDPPTLRRLLTSYMNNIHILHPFLDKQRITDMVERFAMKYNQANLTLSPFAVPAATSPHDPSMGPKRKRSIATIPNTNVHTTSSKSLPERSISSALVLLVLALGKICEHRDPLPSPICETQSTQHMPIDSPPVSIRQSPASSHSSYASAASPNEALRMGMSSRRTSVDGPALSNMRDSGMKNVDVIPGLAYYAYATDILGNLHAGNDLSHIQAHLLAGLYAGQMARSLESWKWINSACTACQVIIRPAKFAREKKLARRDLIIFAFWTCLQLESDLLAELDLPHSGISRYEDTMPLPRGVTLGDHDPEHNKQVTMIYYSAQIQLRKVLNRAHSALYRTEETNPTHAGWSTSNSAHLEYQLKEWRRILPPGFEWKDSDPPATDINAARMRAKYYGARYIIHRPFLHHAIHPMNPQDNLPLNSPNSAFGSPELLSRHGIMRPPPTSTTSAQETITEASQICVEAAMKSTVAFDGIKKRPVVTNIFGTAHAQFGNCLVLAATHRSRLHDLVPREQLRSLLRRTIKFLRDLAPLSPALKTDAEILEHINNSIFGKAEHASSFSSASTYDDHGTSW
ncbi:MAG: hypothetical protein M1812_000013 [Candelaria pacifica]|nr:MAG: hypothetical protein M1812_000013 [Candelaria pacifica]